MCDQGVPGGALRVLSSVSRCCLRGTKGRGLPRSPPTPARCPSGPLHPERFTGSSCLAPPPPTDVRVEGSDETLRGRCLDHPDDLLSVRWLRVVEGQLFATVLHQSQQEVTLVPITKSVATCWGMWWSVVHNKLGANDLARLREAWPQFAWEPLCSVIGSYTAAPTAARLEPILTTSIVAHCRHAGVAAALGEAYRADPFVVRRILNGRASPPSHGECAPAMALVAFCPDGCPANPPCSVLSSTRPPFRLGPHIGVCPGRL